MRIARILSWCACFICRAIGKKDYTVRVTRGGILFSLDLKEGIDFAIFLGLYERSTVHAYQKLVQPQVGCIVLDIGANIGAHTLHLARLVGETGKVYAFEPTHYAFAKLRANIDLNPALRDRIVLVQKMLTSTDAQAPQAAIYSSWPLEIQAKKAEGIHPQHLGALESTAGSTAGTLDSYWQNHVQNQNHAAVLQFIKIDVDGFEYQVLRGASRLLRQHRPLILMELAPYLLEEQGENFADLLSFLREIGYVFYPLDSHKAIESFDFCRSGKSVNVIARVDRSYTIGVV